LKKNWHEPTSEEGVQNTIVKIVDRFEQLKVHRRKLDCGCCLEELLTDVT